MGKHQKHSHFPEKEQGNRKPHEPVIGRSHGKLYDIGFFLREPPCPGIAITYETVQKKAGEADRKGEAKSYNDTSAHVQAADIMYDHAWIRKIDDKFVDAMIHLIVYKIYFSQKPSGK